MTDSATLAEIRARAAEHDDDVQSVTWYTVADLAARWKLSQTTVRLIPKEELHYKEFGAGKSHRRRRYRREWVEAYEAQSGRGDA
jgi:hypothetical protein